MLLLEEKCGCYCISIARCGLWCVEEGYGVSIASFPGHTPIKEWPDIHVCTWIIARVYGTGSVNVFVNRLSHMARVV